MENSFSVSRVVPTIIPDDFNREHTPELLNDVGRKKKTGCKVRNLIDHHPGIDNSRRENDGFGYNARCYNGEGALT